MFGIFVKFWSITHWIFVTTGGLKNTKLKKGAKGKAFTKLLGFLTILNLCDCQMARGREVERDSGVPGSVLVHVDLMNTGSGHTMYQFLGSLVQCVHQALYCGICWLKLYEVPWLKGLHRD